MTDHRSRIDYGERRIVTILFCDVVGSTAMAEQLDPENWIEIINNAFELLISAVHRYGGTVSQLRGDGLLALFGAPEAHEDDPDRAVLAGLTMISGTEALRQRVFQQYGFAFELRVGINSGMVVVGNVGARGVTGYTAIGDAVNVAARVEEMARPGAVEITEATHRMLSAGFKDERLGPVQIRGKREPVVIYRVLRRDDNQQQLTHFPDDAPLFGRNDELARLASATKAVLNGNSGRIAQIIGEAGFGKTRLIRELHQIWRKSSRGRPWMECRGISYDSDRPYGLILQLLFRTRDSTIETVPPARASQVEPTSEGAVTEGENQARSIQHLIASTRSGSSMGQSAERVQREIHLSATQWIRSLAAGGPIALVFDDLQWADASSIELMQELLAFASEIPVLFLCASRPALESVSRKTSELVPDSLRDEVLTISLRALGRSESASLVERLIDPSLLTPGLRESIVTRTEGNPFFIEQVAMSFATGVEEASNDQDGDGPWSLSGDGRSVRIPVSIQSALTARIDRLDRSVRRTLQTAAVVGQEVSAEVLSALSDPADDVISNLRTLVDVDILQNGDGSDGNRFVFRHDLVREAAYESLLRRQRREVHRAVAETIQSLYADQIADHAHRLAHHFSEAGDEENVVFYSMMAGDFSRRVHATAEAAAHYERALASAERTGHRLTGELLLRCGQMALLLGSIDRARNFLEDARIVAQQNGDRELEQVSLYELAGLHTSSDYRLAEELATEALNVARDIGEPSRIGLALNRLGNILTNQLRFTDGRVLHQEAFELFQEASEDWGSADSLDLIGMSHYLAGEVVQARAAFLRAAELFEALDDQERLASALASRGLYLNVVEGACTIDASPVECCFDSERGLQICRSIGWKSGEAYSLASLAGAVLGEGQIDRAFQLIDESLAIATEIGHQQWRLIALYTQGLIYAETMDKDLSTRRFEQALELARTVASRQWEERVISWLDALNYFTGTRAHAHTPWTEVESSISRPAYRRQILSKAAATSATGQHEDALALLESLDTEDDLVSCEESLLRGSILAAMGNTRDADDAFLIARKHGERYGPRGKMWQIAARRASLWAGVDNDVFESEVAIAEHVLDTIARTISDSDRRTMFLTAARRLMP